MPMMSPPRPLAALLLLVAPPLGPVMAQEPAPTSPPLPSTTEAGAPPYADLADLVLASPIVADAVVRSATRIKGAEAAAVPPGVARLYIESDVLALIRGTGGLPPRVGYLLDAPLDPRGRVPKLKKTRVLLFARPVTGTPGQVQLAARDAQLPWTPAAAARVRRIAGEVLAAEVPPAIAGVGQAFHVPGALPGEGETQVFLQTADQRPVSLSVLRRPGEERRWAVALSEIVDEAAGPPARDTLLWYRLACGLPRDLPATSTESLGPDNAARAREDYAFVLARLGACGRTR
jgi:hypothetical protein